MEKLKISEGYKHYLNQKHPRRDWDDETMSNWYEHYGNMDKQIDWLKNAGRVLLIMFVVLIGISILAVISYCFYSLYKAGAYEHIVIILFSTLLMGVIINTLRKKSL